MLLRLDREHRLNGRLRGLGDDLLNGRHVDALLSCGRALRLLSVGMGCQNVGHSLMEVDLALATGRVSFLPKGDMDTKSRP